MSTATTRYGLLRGETVDGVTAFKGVPYASSPFGRNRFLPPQPVQPWEGVRDARAYGPTVPKPPYPAPFDQLVPDVDVPGEDCLNLNVWTPDLTGALPVMVWLHGGSFTNGSGAVAGYDGSRFARDGVVFVTVNYRLGADGFLFLGDGDTANLGLLDQVAALRWVRDTIAVFGGDPANVTVAGESAGAMSIGALLASPGARGLFRRAVLQSGAAHHTLTPATARRIGVELAGLLRIPPSREAFAEVPLSRLTRVGEELRATIAAHPDPVRWGEVTHNLMPFEPVVDGELLPAAPLDRIAAGSADGIDVLIGTNSDEFRLFLVPTGAVDLVDEAGFRAAAAGYGLEPGEALATYRETCPDGTPGDLLAALITDWYYLLPAIRLAEAVAGRGGNTYLYEFAWASTAFDGKLGACHTAEMPFVFDNLDDPAQVPVLGPEPPQHLADLMHSAWVSFATDGDPGWAAYDLHSRDTMRFDTSSKIVSDPASRRRSLWTGKR